MISLITGLPGHGKTLHIISMLYEMNKDNSTRTVYVCGIDHLRSDLLPNLKIVFIDYDAMNGWQEFDNGSLIIVDEAQHWAIARSKGEIPDHIQKLTVHRHQGFDFIFLTQQPRLLDVWIRRLVNEHIHIRRVYGGKRQNVFKWDEVKEDPRDPRAVKVAVVERRKLNSKVFEFYKSSTDHNVKSRLPKKVKIFFIGVALFVVAVVALVFNLDYFFNTEVDTGNNNSSGSVLPVVSGVQAVQPLSDFVVLNQHFPIKYCRRVGYHSFVYVFEVVFVDGTSVYLNTNEFDSYSLKHVVKDRKHYCSGFPTFDDHPKRKFEIQRSIF